MLDMNYIPWDKYDSQSIRRDKVLASCKGSYKIAASTLLRIGKKHTDNEIRRKAIIDYNHFAGKLSLANSTGCASP